MSDDGYGTDIEFTQELQDVLHAAESQPAIAFESSRSLSAPPVVDDEVTDIEDLVQPSPFEEFKNGYLSVTDLVGTVWCEVQYDYRLRTLPYLPVAQRPEKITTKAGKEITVDKVKVEDKDKILKRGQVIHERLEREFHVRIELVPETREDVWGLRFLNMLSVLESAIDLGTGRELPVVGFVGETMVLGVIDEISLEEIETKKVEEKVENGPKQTSLTSFYSLTKPKPQVKSRTHRLRVSDSKTRASGTMPKESDTTAGQLQLMLYKELLDAMLNPTKSGENNEQANVTMSFERVFTHLGLHPDQAFSDGFRAQSEPIITGNKLRFDVGAAKCLNDMVIVWERYVDLLGLGEPGKGHEVDGKTEDRMELVYRRADRKKKGKRKRALEATSTITEVDATEDAEDRLLQLAIQRSLEPEIQAAPTDSMASETAPPFLAPPAPAPMTQEEKEREEDAIALEIEMSYRDNGQIEHEGEAVVIRASQEAPSSPPAKEGVSQPETLPAKKSGDIIGRHRFKHDPKALARHLEKVMGYWRGSRSPEGVGIADTRRCGWCEFEEGCEWRLKKAQEALERIKIRREKG